MNSIENVQKTGNCVNVFMEYTGGNYKITVQDDGVGFEPPGTSQNVKKPDGFGLFSIRERMSDLGGEMEIDSEPGRGSKVILTVALSIDDEVKA